MPILVTLNVYSGRPDPSWLLQDIKALELQELLRSLPEQTPIKARWFPPKFGYRGFSVRSVPRGILGGLRLIANAGIVDPGPEEPSLLDRNRIVEKWLLESAAQNIPEILREYVDGELAIVDVSERIKRLRDNLIIPNPTCEGPPSHAVDAPLYEPDPWNVHDVRDDNNCYNYVNDKMLRRFSDPGFAHGISIDMSCNSTRSGPNLIVGVIDGALADGLSIASDFSAPRKKGDGWYVALAVWPSHDYHWFRQDSSGCWSHKLGSASVTNLDGQSNIITNPQDPNCDRGCYTDFCSFMVTYAGISIGGVGGSPVRR